MFPGLIIRDGEQNVGSFLIAIGRLITEDGFENSEDSGTYTIEEPEFSELDDNVLADDEDTDDAQSGIFGSFWALMRSAAGLSPTAKEAGDEAAKQKQDRRR